MAMTNKSTNPDLKNLQRVKTLKSGDSFGELALINNRRRLATIISDANTHVAIIRKADYNKILQKIDEIKILREMGFFASLPLFVGWNLNLTR
jgi:CRP-like cAMP-binding protein